MSGIFFQTVTSRCSGDLSNSVHMGHFSLVSSDCSVLFTQLNFKMISITQEGKNTIEFLTIVIIERRIDFKKLMDDARELKRY